jgi:hypothetical protein
LKFFSSSTTLVVALKTLSHVINLMPQQNWCNFVPSFLLLFLWFFFLQWD